VTSSKPLWTRQDVAKFLGNISTKTVSRMRIPQVRLPGSGSRDLVRYDPDEVVAWVEERKTSNRKGKRTA
jgi:hypothetical protein